MAAEESQTKSFLSKYIKAKQAGSDSGSNYVGADELSTFGINPLVEGETSKKTKQMLNDIANEQTKLSLND